MERITDRAVMDEVLFRALRAIFQFERGKVAVFHLTFEEIYLLQFLRRKSPRRVSEIAEEMKNPISTLSRTIDRLQKRGLVLRKQDGKDKRVIQISLSAKGKKMVLAVEDHSFELITRNLEGYTPADIAAFIKTADALERILGVTAQKKREEE